MRTPAAQPRKRDSAIYALAIDDHNVHCMTEALLDVWWASLEPEDKADLYALHLATATPNPGGNDGNTGN